MNSYILGPITYSPLLFRCLASISNVVCPKLKSPHHQPKQTKQIAPIVGNINTILSSCLSQQSQTILNFSSSPTPTFNIRIAHKLYLQNLS